MGTNKCSYFELNPNKLNYRGNCTLKIENFSSLQRNKCEQIFGWRQSHILWDTFVLTKLIKLLFFCILPLSGSFPSALSRSFYRAARKVYNQCYPKAYPERCQTSMIEHFANGELANFNSFIFILRYAQVRYVKCLFTNIQKQ